MKLTRLLLPLFAVGAVVVACGSSSSKEKPRGQLMVAIQADMPIPAEVSDIRVEVLQRGDLKFGNDFTMGAGYTLLPATVGIVADDDTTDPVTIRIIAKQNTADGVITRMLRETVTTIPKDRTATLRMPIQWLCDKSVKANPDGTVSTACPDGQTCHAGQCVANTATADDLPTYSPPDVFGGGDETGKNGACFDTVPCMLSGVIASPDVATCSFKPAAPAGSNINVALRVPEGGICDSGNINCFVPLDGNSADGWQVSNGTITLPKAACDRLSDGHVTAVVVSTSCPTKTEGTPTCGPWSSVSIPTSGTPVDAGAAEPSLVATVPAAANAPSATVCCPLMTNGTDLVTCLCQAGSAQINVVAIASATGAVRSIASPPVLAIRSTVPSVIANGALFFTDRDSSNGVKGVLKKMTLEGGQVSEVTRVTADIYDEGTLLADDKAIYALAGNVSLSDAAAPGTSVNVLAFDPNAAGGVPKAFDVGSDKAVFQFVQDTQNVYVISITDTGSGPEPWQRTSSILAIDKTNGTRSTKVASTVTTNTYSRGGYFSLHLGSDSALYATFEDTVASDGSYASSILHIDPTSGAKTTLLQDLLKTDGAENKTLGSSGASLFIFEKDFAGPGTASPTDIRSSGLSILPTNAGAQRPVADFTSDVPLAGLVEDASFVYWMNRSGRVFKLSKP